MKTILIEKFVKRVVSARPQETLVAIARLMEQHNVGAVVLAENSRPVGILTDRDLTLHVVARGVSGQTPAVRVMSTPVQTVSRDDGVRRLPIVDKEGQLVGIVSLDDVTGLLGRKMYNLAEGIKHATEVK
jgi:CBS domain-containing protein